MDRNTRGKATHIGGRIKEELGEILGDREMERKGRLDHMEGRAEQDLDRAEEAAADPAARRAAAQRAKRF